MESNKINELIKSVEALVYYSQIYTVKGVQPVHMPDHETAWKNAQRWIWDNCKADKMGNYHLKEVPTGPRWVKCSDRLPGYKLRVKWRDGNDHSYATDGEISMFEMEKPNLEGWEWLDEQPAAGREEEDFAFTEWVKMSTWGFVRGIGWQKYGDPNPSKYITTAELYELFKQQKEK